tara:strand:- start:238 stop:975 length:738 start_codon:yes stop_codon:yes gene_type:complete
MIVIPAIDLKDGRCVRLLQGDMSRSTVFSDDPVSVARRWKDYGCKRLHLVDLNGAFAGEPVNGDIVEQIAEEMADVPIQVGGGIRTLETIERYCDAGASNIIIGTKAISDIGFVIESCRSFPGKISVGLDARDGRLATEGWSKVSSLMAIEYVEKLVGLGVFEIIYTDISRDGMMGGVNVEATLSMARATNIPIVASGGIRDLEDIKRLLEVSSAGIVGAITGRAIYESTLDFKQAQLLCDEWVD